MMPGRTHGAWSLVPPLCLVLVLPAAFFSLARFTPPDLPGAAAARSASRVSTTIGSEAAGFEACAACHDTTGGYVEDPDHVLNRRVRLSRQAWADSLQLAVRCGACHRVPDPSHLPTSRWGDAVVNFMSRVVYYLDRAPAFEPPPTGRSFPQWAHLTRAQWMDVTHYYLAFSGPESPLPPDPSPDGPAFAAAPIGIAALPRALSQIGNVNVVDLDRDGAPDILVSDFSRHAVSWIRRDGEAWQERSLAPAPYPGHAEAGDFDGDGDLDVVVADVGSITPTDDPVGRVLLLTNDGTLQFEARTLLDDVGRVADVRPGDFDGDGDIDFVVAVFGFLTRGEIGWLERQAGGAYAYHRLSAKKGAVHVPPVDLDGDGRLDVVALIAQENEEVAAFLNRGDGRFEERILFKADDPTFGSSGIELTDLDRDGDVDILYTNGDAYDLSTPDIRPYHGVQWLENVGGLDFVYHDLIRYYGAYRALPADLDGDGDLDVVATSLLNDWADTTRMSLLWLENDGRQRFTPHGIGNAPTALITAAIADLDGDGRPDIVTGSMHMTPADPRRGRVTLWRNPGFGDRP